MQFLNMMNRLQTLIDLLLPSGQIIVGDAGGNAAAVTMSGDTTIDNVGAVTIADNAVTPRKTLQIMVFFVAANDANQEEIDEADFICDGTDDDVQIQAALNSLPSVGGTVVLSSGNFSVSVRILETTDNVHLKGSGRESTIIKDTLDSGNQAILQFNGDDCSISDLTIDGDDAVLTGATHTAINMFTSANSRVENVRVIQSSNKGILFSNASTSGQVINCIVDASESHAIQFNNGVHDFYISGNIVKNTKTGGGIWVDGITNVTQGGVIVNNISFNTNFEPINVQTTSQFIVANNVGLRS